jgi:membrane protease YdiL (CAAX protease family)
MTDNTKPENGTPSFPWNGGFLRTLGAIIVVFFLFNFGSMIGQLGLSYLVHNFVAVDFVKANKQALVAALGVGRYIFGATLCILFLKRICKSASVFTVIRGRASDIRGNWGKTFGWAIVGYFLVLIFDAIYMALPVAAPHVPSSDFAQTLGGSALIIFGLGAALTGPFFEEILFRGYAYNMFGQSFRSRFASGSTFASIAATVLATLLSAALFSAMHMTLSAFIPLFMFGVINAEVYRRSGNIYAPMLVHFFNNGMVAVMMLLASHAA